MSWMTQKRAGRLILLGVFLLVLGLSHSSPALAQTCPDGSSAPCAEDPALDGCTACHGYQIVGGNRDGSDRWIWLSSGAVRHQIAPKRSDWTSNVQSMINKGARSSLEVTAGYLNTNYCPTCTGMILGSPFPGSITETSATVTWSTSKIGFEDEPADTVLYFGTNQADVLLGSGCSSCQVISDPTPLGNHVVNLSGLSSNTQYFVMNEGTSPLGTVTSTYTANFRTKRAAGGGGLPAVPQRIYISDRGSTKQLVVIDPETNSEITNIPLVVDPGELAAHPGGRTVYAAVGEDLAVVDVLDNFILDTVTGVSELFPHLAASPDGTRLYLVHRTASPAALEIKIFNVSDSTAPALISTHSDPVMEGCNSPLGLGIHPDGNKLYTICRSSDTALGDRFFVMDIGSGGITQTATVPRDATNIPFINALGVSPDGTRVFFARAHSSTATVEIFDGATGANAGSIALPATALPRALAVKPDGSRLYVADQRLGTHVIDLGTDTLLGTWTSNKSRGMDIAISPNGTRVDIPLGSSVFVWDTGPETWTTTISGSFNLVMQIVATPGAAAEGVSAPSQIYLSERGRTKQLAVIDAEFGEEAAIIPLIDDPGEMAPHPGGLVLYAAVGEDLAVVDIPDNFIFGTVTGVSELFPHLVSSPDGTRLYLVHRKASPAQLEIKVFDTTDSTAPTLISTHTDPVMSGCYTPLGLEIHPDGSKLFTICRSTNTALPDRFFVMDIGSGGISQTATVPRDVTNIPFINAMDVAPDGSRVFFARAHTSPATVEIFDGATGANAGTVALPANALPRALAVSLDGTRLYVADQRLGTHVIDLETDTLLKTLTATQSRGLDLAVTPDGTRLYISLASSLFVWDTATETWLETIKGSFRSAFSIAISPGTP